jgi:hypothetical protein
MKLRLNKSLLRICKEHLILISWAKKTYSYEAFI